MNSGSTPAVEPGRSDRPAGSVPDIEGHLDGDHILVPLLAAEVSAVTDQLRVAASLARATDATLHVVNPVSVPDVVRYEYRDDVTTDDEEALLEWAVDQVTGSSRTDGGVLFARTLVDGLCRTVAANDVDTLVVASDGGGSVVRRDLVDRLSLHADCDVVTVNGRRGFGPTPSLLLAIAGGPHSGLAADVAQRVAADCDAWIDVLHVVDEDPSPRQHDRAEALVDAAYRRIDRPESTTTWVLEADDVADAIITHSAYYELTVVGASTKGRLRQFVFGSTNKTIRDNARSVVLSTRSNG